MRVEAAANTSNGRTERKGGDLEGAHVDSHEVGHGFVVMHRGHRNAKTCRKQQPHQRDDNGSRGGDGRKPNKGRDRIAGRPANDFEIENDRLHDLAQREGGKRQVDAARAQHRRRHDERHRSGHNAGEGNSDERGKLEDVAEVSRGIGADGGEAGQAKIELSRRERQKAAIGEDHVDGEQNQNAFEISAHARCPANAAANSPVGRTHRMSNSSP